MELQSRLLGALLIAYFVSRLTLRLPNPLRKAWGITLAHVLALAVTIATIVALRGTGPASVSEQVLLYISPQVLWWLFDLLREHTLGHRFIGRGSR